MADIASPIKTLGNFPAVDTTVAAIGTADQIADGTAKVMMMAEERTRLAGMELSTFETLDTDTVLFITDDDDRVIFTLPDPAVAVNKEAIDELEAAGLSFEVYETLATDVILFITDAENRVIQAVYASDPDLALSVAANTSAIAALTASVLSNVADLAIIRAQVASVVTPEGVPRNNPLNRDKLRWTHMKLAKLDPVLGESAQLIICAGGDSYTHNVNRWIGPFTAKMAAKYGDAGGGWCGFGFLPSGNVAPWTLGNQPSYIQGNARPNSYPTIHIGSAVGTYYSTASPDLAQEAMAIGDTVYQGMPGLPVHNGCDLFFKGSADGVVEFAWGTYNGSGNVSDPANYTFGATTSLNVQGTVNALQIADIKAGIPAGAGMLRITCTAGAPVLYGAYLKSAASGVRVNKLAATGSKISQWANAPATHFEAGIAALAPDLFIYMDGTNSQAAGISRSSWGAQLASLMGRIRAARPSTDILSATPAENQRTTNPIAMTEYALENLYRASVGKWCAVDMQPLFGDAANPGEYGSTGSMPLYASDLIHPNPATGGRMLLVGMLDPIVPYRGA